MWWEYELSVTWRECKVFVKYVNTFKTQLFIKFTLIFEFEMLRFVVLCEFLRLLQMFIPTIWRKSLNLCINQSIWTKKTVDCELK